MDKTDDLVSKEEARALLRCAGDLDIIMSSTSLAKLVHRLCLTLQEQSSEIELIQEILPPLRQAYRLGETIMIEVPPYRRAVAFVVSSITDGLNGSEVQLEQLSSKHTK